MVSDRSEHKDFRANVVEFLSGELVGPGPGESDENQREVLSVSPLQLYAAGVLFPQNSTDRDLEDESTSESSSKTKITESDDDEVFEVTTDGQVNKRSFEAEEAEAELNLANQFNPSALGITVRVKGDVKLDVEVIGGRYISEKIAKPHPRRGEERLDGSRFPEEIEVTQYRRVPVNAQLTITVKEGLNNRSFPIDDHSDGSLHLHVRQRSGPEETVLVSLALVNGKKISGSAAATYRSAYFQTSLHAKLSDSEGKFCPIDLSSPAVQREDDQSLDLLYRKKRSYGLGHGCSADWQENGGSVHSVWSRHIPMVDLKPVVPRTKPLSDEAAFDLSMELLAGKGFSENENERIVRELDKLCEDYERWIDREREKSKSLDNRFKDTAERHIQECMACLKRMREGVVYLKSDKEGMVAFRIANKAMWMQQIRTNLSSCDDEILEKDWNNIDFSAGMEPRWRPFQLAFVLMNIACCADKNNTNRRLVDLIWFPTGGGKTEAYLGLAAFSIALRRLRNVEDEGVCVLMRYTLRLLTAQQFQRAAALLTSLEVLRQEGFIGADLGRSPISIGLWVGDNLSPNKRKDALYDLRQLQGKGYGRNRFQLLRCPWCDGRLDNADALGYEKERIGLNGEESVIFRCKNGGCRFSQKNSRLPVLVIDEDIYESPPTLLVGTVDKFAQLAWDSRTGAIFGVNQSWKPPELIIQDELHLISGPLGTIVGLYEALIEQLCNSKGGTPKIIASTATIREAKSQCRGLYARQSFQFPPQGLEAGDSYFAYEDSGAPGRLYVGVFGTAVKSHATAQVRVVASLLQAVMPATSGKSYRPDVADLYATVLWYFNSLRELGHALTMCTGDIPEYHFNICKRRSVARDDRRILRNVQELTSRRTADEIPKILEELEKHWRPRPEHGWPVDILLATNMISVGVDISRLGTMVVGGQPKSTAEYIQASSRVGRGYPGLVVTVYNPARSRDRSHFEQFRGYHQGLYRYVEPTSVTPFSSPARARGLSGVVIGMVRQLLGIEAPNDVNELEESFLAVKEKLLDRIRAIDPREVDDSESEIDLIIKQWEEARPNDWGWMAGLPETQTLMYPYGREPVPDFEEEAFPVLTSMRNVDASCSAKVINSYRRAME